MIFFLFNYICLTRYLNLCCTCCLQEYIPLRWQRHRLLCPPVFSPRPILDTPQEDTCQEEDGQSFLRSQVRPLDLFRITWSMWQKKVFSAFLISWSSCCVFKAHRLRLSPNPISSQVWIWRVTWRSTKQEVGCVCEKWKNVPFAGEKGHRHGG